MNEIILTTAGALVGTVVETWVKPKLEDLYKKKEIDHNFYNLVSENFANYLSEVYKNQLVINTIVFRNQQKIIDELYFPLYVNKYDNEGENVSIQIDKYVDEFIPKYKKILITDTAGMGKSTIMKWLFISAIRQKVGIPIFIELRKLSKDNKVIKQIFKSINPIDNNFNTEYILKLLKRGDFIFFFDGYDEIPTKDREEVTNDIQEFISKTGENLFIISSREERALMSFGDFQRFNIKPLEKEEAYDLIKKYDKNGDVSKELITKIGVDENFKLLKEFLTNPLMVSLLYKAYEFKKSIPYKKHIFYRQVYDALFEDHDYTKGGSFVHEKKSKLDIDDFETILKIIAYESFKKGKIIFDRDEIIQLIKIAKEKSPHIQFKESEFLEDLIVSVPLFAKDGVDYKWIHKSFQEYFAAKYICHNLKNKQKDILVSMSRSMNNDNYYNVLDFCYDIDYLTFKRTIIFDLISNYIEYYNNSYKNFISDEITNKNINMRKRITFLYEYFIIGKKDFDGADLSEVHKKCAEKIRDIIFEKNIRFRGLMRSSLFDDFAIGYCSSPHTNIAKLLYNKGEDFIKFEYNPMQIEELVLQGLTYDDPIFLNDSKDNVLNENNNFTIMNEIINELKEREPDDISKCLELDIDKCIRLKVLIEKEIQKENEEVDIF
ncbi:NACHT domain-containing protein [Crassaminicella profunda]|uniref:NACHT domain-containing protein n=1 Tax=Crassaminicella profunda TaxID=1286698 RepID=UPI001CA6D386|nr:NACHT domain-containing protein [Crassaminicella profunda]QZY56495.1 NACHT domain-containing protein [Crassaminicella profunda]